MWEAGTDGGGKKTSTDAVLEPDDDDFTPKACSPFHDELAPVAAQDEKKVVAGEGPAQAQGEKKIDPQAEKEVEAWQPVRVPKNPLSDLKPDSKTALLLLAALFLRPVHFELRDNSSEQPENEGPADQPQAAQAEPAEAPPQMLPVQAKPAEAPPQMLPVQSKPAEAPLQMQPAQAEPAEAPPHRRAKFGEVPPQALPAEAQAELPPQGKPALDKPAQQEIQLANELPDLNKATWFELESMASDPYKFERFKGANEEMIRRVDRAMPAGDLKKSLEAIPMILKSLKEGKALVPGPDGKMTLSDQDLTPADRLKLHDAIDYDLNIVAQQTMTRLDYSQRLYGAKQFEDAERFAKEAIEKSDLLPKDLLEQAGKQLIDDLKHIADPELRKQMQKRAISYSSSTAEPSLYRLPLMTRKSLATMYLGVTLSLLPNGQVEPKLGETRAFKPDKAYELAKETREKTKELLGFDPMDENAARQDPSVATIFGSIMEVLNTPEKFNLYDLVDKTKLEDMQRDLKKSTTLDSMLVDIGVVALVAGTLCLSRSPKTHAMIEQMLGHSANAETRIVPTLTKIAGLGTSLLAAPLVRHYGYQQLSGLEESWTDTGVHVVGSLAAAELGGRLLGKGSMATGSPGRGIKALEGFDSFASSEWLSRQGYETTGKVADLLIANGHAREANILLKLPRTTALGSDAGLRALEAAELTQSRMSSVGKAVVNDQKLASGIDHTRLAKALESGGTKSIKDMKGLQAQINEDIGFLQQVDGQNLGRGTSIGEALGPKALTPEGTKIQERLAELGVENVGQARKLLRSLSKGLEEQFPKLYELEKANLITPSTTLAEVAAMTGHAFDGPGCARLIKLIPESERAGILSDRTLYALSKGEKPQGKIQQALAEQYNGSAHNVPSYYELPGGNRLKNTVWGASLQGAAGTVLTYNSIVKVWDQMQYINPNTGQNYTFSEAMKEAHLPDVVDKNAPEWLRFAGSVVSGSPGQIVLASLLIRPGAIAKPVWADKSLGGFEKAWGSTSPLSHRAWNNWNAGIFSKPGMGSAGALSASLVEPAKEAVFERSDRTRLRRMLENVQKPIQNEEPPKK